MHRHMQTPIDHGGRNPIGRGKKVTAGLVACLTSTLPSTPHRILSISKTPTLSSRSRYKDPHLWPINQSTAVSTKVIVTSLMTASR